VDNSEIRLGSSTDFFSSTGSAETWKEEAAWACTEGTAKTREEEDTEDELNSELTNKETKPWEAAGATGSNNSSAGRGGWQNPKEPDDTIPLPSEDSLEAGVWLESTVWTLLNSPPVEGINDVVPVTADDEGSDLMEPPTETEIAGPAP